jgi:hypothetical protein
MWKEMWDVMFGRDKETSNRDLKADDCSVTSQAEPVEEHMSRAEWLAEEEEAVTENTPDPLLDVTDYED